MLQKALLVTCSLLPEHTQQLLGCCSTENFQFSRWWAVTQYSYWYTSTHHPFTLCGGKSSLSFLPPESIKHHLASASLICHISSYLARLLSEARPCKTFSVLSFFSTNSLFQLLPKYVYTLKNMGSAGHLKCHFLLCSACSASWLNKSEWLAQSSFILCQVIS